MQLKLLTDIQDFQQSYLISQQKPDIFGLLDKAFNVNVFSGLEESMQKRSNKYETESSVLRTITKTMLDNISILHAGRNLIKCK